MSWEISWALCRACMDTDNELFPLYNETTENDLSNNLAELAEIEISKADGLPTKLCKKCILKIRAYSKFKKLVQESDRKLRSMFITEFSYETKNNQMKDESEEEIEDQVENQMEDESEEEIDDQIENQMEDQAEEEIEDQVENQMEDQAEDQMENQMEKQVEDQMKNQLEKQLEEQMENQMEKQLEEQIEEQMQVKMEVKMKIKYAESEIDGTLGYIYNNGDESSTDNIEKNCVQELNPIVEEGTESSIDNSCYTDCVNGGQSLQNVLKSNMWKIVYNIEKSENIDEENNSAQSIPFAVNKEVGNQESFNQNEKRRKTLPKAKMKKKKVKNIENSTADAKETNNNSDASDFDSYIENLDNIVGSLNDTITKVKEIREDGKDTYYQCTLCLQNYAVLSEALTHIVDWHVPVNGPFYCVVCEMDCENIKHLKNHVKIHKGDNPYICFLCNKAYVMKRYLKRHMVCHTDFPRHRCTKCGERFKVKTDLETHLKSHNEVAAFSCSQCSRVFNHKGNYKRHLITHLDPQGLHIPKYPCQVCNKRFLNNRTLDNHMRVHTGERPFKCDTCGKAFSQKGNLLNHTKVHTNPRSFVCEVCGKKFNQKATLKDHSKLHTGEKSYVCTMCGVAFTFSAALGRHMWSHSDKKPYACDICDATFVGKYDLKRHLKTHNGNSKRNSKAEKVNEENVIDISKDVSGIAQETSDGNTIVIEQIFLCEDSIKIISQEQSGNDNADSILCLM